MNLEPSVHMNNKVRKLWVFGDSFGHHNENWIKKLAEKCNCEVTHLGIGGSSVQFLLIDLYKYITEIQEDDRVIILITNTARFYLNNHHLQPTSLEKDTPYVEADAPYLRQKSSKFNPMTVEKMNAYRSYMLELYTAEEDRAYKGAIVAHILHTVIPQIPTKYTQYLFSIDSRQYLHELNTKPNFSEYCYYINKREYENLGLYIIADTFVKANKEVLGYWETKTENNLQEIINTPNHWIDHPEYEEYFWKHVDPILLPLYTKS